jgi:SAM-dependent methyltransferase
MTASYTTDGKSLRALLPAAWRQLRSIGDQKRRLPELVHSYIGTLERFQQSAESLTGLTLRDLDVLEIGHGQSQHAIAYVAALGNRAVGIDLDVVPHGLLDVAGYMRTIRTNGFMRAAKTWVREASGLNRSLRREFVRQRGLSAWPSYRTLVADAANMGFPDQSFDFIYSFHVLEHVADPAAVLREVQRLLRPGGGFWFRFPHYAHYNALHDLRWITQSANPPRPWAHLLEGERAAVQQGAFVNTLRIDDWRQLFAQHFPGCSCLPVPLDSDHFPPALADVRARGLLREYSDEELLTDDLICAWRKP